MQPPAITPVTSPLRRRVRPLAIGLAAAAVGVLAWPRLAAWQQGRFAEQLAQRVVQSNSASVASVRDMWQLGLPATQPLVELAAAQRPELAAAAQQALADQVAAWELEFATDGDAEAFAERLALLSGSLRAHSGRFDSAGQLWAKKLSRSMAQNAAHLEAEASWAVLTACEHVLSTPEVARPTAPTIVNHETGLAPQTTPAPVVVPTEAKPLPAAVPKPATPTVDAPPSPPAELSVIMPSTEPPRTNTAIPASPPRPADEMFVSEDSLAITAVPNATAPAASSPVDVPSPRDMRHKQQRLRELSDRDLMAMSDTASRFEAAAARQVLRSRGYSDQLLELTRQLRALPGLERRQALERAAALPAADARRLLRWFVADEDADVRLYALTMLATTGDPQLNEIARQRAIEDGDPRVAELATKLLDAR